MGTTLKSINSLSGGKTSSYMAVHYPADYNIFSLVCIDSIGCQPADKSMIRFVNEKLDKYGYIKKYGEFIATAEDDSILYTMRDLEQMIGKEIVWVRGDSFDDVIKKKGNVVPNMARRFCTTEMKMVPIAGFVYHNIMDDSMTPVTSNVGFRYDEDNRAKEDRNIVTKIVVGNRGTRNRWEEVLWGVANYPLIDNKTTHYTVKKFWEENNIKFANDSNCVGCFWKDAQQLRKNWDENTKKMEWFSRKEAESKYNYKSSMTYEQIKKIGLQLDFQFGTGSGCQAGFCTD